jgi:tetratricopeptide (TPR) repeat protein
MKTRKIFGALLLIVIAAGTARAEAVSEQARRYMARGMAAMEIAKDASAYQKAVKEFREAVRAAPDWADAWYNLGVAQESAEDYSGAITSFKTYLQKNPESTDRDAVETRIYKLEYRQEEAARAAVEERERQARERRARIQKLAGIWVYRYMHGTKVVSEEFWDLVTRSANSLELRYKYTKDYEYATIEPIKQYIELTVQGDSLSGTEYFHPNYSHWRCNSPMWRIPISGNLKPNGDSISLVRGSHQKINPTKCQWEHQSSGHTRELRKR